MLSDVLPGLDANLWVNAMGDFGRFDFQDMVKAMNYLSLVEEFHREKALKECGLSPKMSVLVAWLQANGINYDVAVDLFWVAHSDSPGYSDEYYLMSVNPSANARYAADLCSPCGEDLRVGPTNMAQLWEKVSVSSFGQRESVAESVVLGNTESIEAVIQLMLVVSAIHQEDVGEYRARFKRDVKMDIQAVECGLSYLIAFPEEERKQVFLALGFSPMACDLVPYVLALDPGRVGPVRCQWVAMDHVGAREVVGLVVVGVEDGQRDSNLVGTLKKCGDRRLGPVDCVEYGRITEEEDGFCYLPLFQQECRESVKSDLGSWPLITDVVFQSSMDKYDRDVLETTFVHYRGHGVAHFSTSVKSDVSVLSLVSAMLNRRAVGLRDVVEKAFRSVRVGGSYLSAPINREVYRVPAGLCAVDGYSVEFDFGEDVIVQERDVSLESLVVSDGTVAIAMTKRDRLRVEAELDSVDIPVLLMSEVDKQYHKHVWNVRYDGEDGSSVRSKFQITGVDSGFSLNYVQGPKWGGMDEEVSLWCRTSAVGLGFSGFEFDKRDTQGIGGFLSRPDMQTFGDMVVVEDWSGLVIPEGLVVLVLCEEEKGKIRSILGDRVTSKRIRIMTVYESQGQSFRYVWFVRSRLRVGDCVMERGVEVTCIAALTRHTHSFVYVRCGETDEIDEYVTSAISQAFPQGGGSCHVVELRDAPT